MSEEMCEMCGIRPSTVLFTQSLNGYTIQKKLCRECVEKMQFFSFEDMFNPAEFFSSSIESRPNVKKLRVCKCGTTEKDLLNNLKFGCSDCYEVFSDIVGQFVANMGGKQHKGKNPIKSKTQKLSNDDKHITLQDKIEFLKSELKKAVDIEDFDKASQLKRQIDTLKEENDGQL